MKIDLTKIGLGVCMLATLTGCVGYVDGGYVEGGGTVIVDGPEVGFFGGHYERGHDFERGRDVHVYSHRGAVSREVAHGRGGEGRKR